MANKADELKKLIESDTRSITNLSSQLQKLQDQLDYHQDKLKYHKEQLQICLSAQNDRN